MAKGIKIVVRKTPCGLHPYVARAKHFVTYGWGNTAAEARLMLKNKINQGPTY